MFIFTIICSLFIDRRKKYKSNSRFYRFLLETCTKIVVFFGRIHIHTTGIEKVPENTRFLLVGNHISNFDPILTWHVLNKNKLIFISKPENFKQPVFGAIIQRCCFLSIDRESPRDSVRTIMDAAALMKEDKFSVGVYPEGTRNRPMQETLLPFHNGMLKIAQSAHAPVVVVTMKDTNLIEKNFPWKRSDVYLDVLDVIPAEEAAAMRTGELGDKVRDMMLANLEK